MAVETELGRVRKVRTELQEEGAKVLVQAVEVINVDHGARIDDPGNGPAGLQAFAGGAGDSDLFLSNADKEHFFVRFEGAEFLLEDIIFALALLKADQLQVLALDEGLDGLEEIFG